MKFFAALVLLFATPILGQEPLEFRAILDGPHALPPNQSAMWSRTWFTLFPDNHVSGNVTLEWEVAATPIIYRSTSSSELGVQLFVLPAGAFNPPLGNGGGEQNYDLNATLTTSQVSDLVAGNWWVNVATPAFPGGELRGQIQIVPEASTFALVAGGLLLLCRFVRKR
jgi:hypothetical protein